MHQRRLVIGDEKLIELNTEVGMERGDAKDVRGDFRHMRWHGFAPV
jgi:hypothetical protein